MTSAQKRAFIKLHGLENYSNVEFMDYTNNLRKVEPINFYDGKSLCNSETNLVQTPEGLQKFANKVTGFMFYRDLNNETFISRNTGYGISYVVQIALGAQRCKEKMVTMFIKGGAEIMFFITQFGPLSNADAIKLAMDALSQTNDDIQLTFHNIPCVIDYVPTLHGPLGFLGD